MNYTFTVPPELAGLRLDRALVKLAGREGIELSRSDAKRKIESGNVSLGGNKNLLARDTVSEGDLVEAFLVETSSPGDEPAPGLKALRPGLIDLSTQILFQDTWLLAINKPAGLPTHATPDPNRDHCQAAVERILSAQGIEQPYVAVHHRLDVDTTGVLLFAIHRDANRGLTESFREHRAQKTYIAVVATRPDIPSNWVVEDHLAWNRKERCAESVRSGGDYARTEFRVLSSEDGLTRVEAKPHTGRRHQIRAHLAEFGIPIVGDARYGGPERVGSFRAERPLLHAIRLEVEHPISAERLMIEAPEDELQA